MNNSNTNYTSLIAGVDDATKCPCIGSIFIAGVTANAETIAHWHKIGVKDSKLIAPKKREQLAEMIKNTAQSFAIREIIPAMIDNKGLNLNEWEMAVVLNVINALRRGGTAFETLHIDNWEVTESHFTHRFAALIDPSMKEILYKHKIRLNRKALHGLTLIPEHRADEKHTVVGAASILAKTASDEQYRKYKKKYGDFGSGSPADPKTRHFVWQHRKKPLSIIRTSWQTFKTLSRLDCIEDDPLYARLKKPLPESI